MAPPRVLRGGAFFRRRPGNGHPAHPAARLCRPGKRPATFARGIGGLRDLRSQRHRCRRWPSLMATREAEGGPHAASRSGKWLPGEILKAVRNHWAIKKPTALGFGRADAGGRPAEPGRKRGRACLAAGCRLALSIVRLADGELSLQKRFLRAAQVPHCRIELIGRAGELSTGLEVRKRLTECPGLAFRNAASRPSQRLPTESRCSGNGVGILRVACWKREPEAICGCRKERP